MNTIHKSHLAKSYLYGKEGIESIRENISSFWDAVDCLCIQRNELIAMAKIESKNVAVSRLSEVNDIASGTGIQFESILCYNLCHSQIFQEGCTVFFAAGKSSGSGYTLFGKNSDKSGSEQLLGKHCFINREINTVSYFENDDGSHIVGVSAAGSTGLKMGMNSYGVAVGTNYGFTVEATKKALSLKDTFASDRAQIARDALTQPTALSAAQFAASHLMKQPMASSGILEFADADEVYIIESSYDCIAIKKVSDEVDSRANNFITLKKLNQSGNTSSFCRYHRTQEMLKEKRGHVTVEDMKLISMDHFHGIGSNSICRHTPGLDSSTLSSAIMAINGIDPKKSKIHIALGKPCNAWRKPDGHIAISMDWKRSEIPDEFLNGEVFKKYCISKPIEE